MNDPRTLLARYLRQRGALGTGEWILEPGTLGGLRKGSPADLPVALEQATPDTPAQVVTAAKAVAVANVPAADALDELGQRAAGCTACPLCETRTNVVFGEGNRSARIVVVGEAPGADEDRTGRPFVGKAGRLLDALLLSIGFPRESVYICNVLKCRPPQNRNPKPEEVETCSPYLRRQLELISPAAILAVGTFPAQTLLATTEPIGRLRGTVQRFGDIPLIPTYHPAAVLRNPTWIRPVWEDLQCLRRMIDG